jgi:catechol 2,3-dioxygenase-like lactoylglutathione lyase family enzyme
VNCLEDAMLPFSRMKHICFDVENIEEAENRFSKIFGIRSAGIRTISLEDRKGTVKTTFFHLEEGSIELACHRLPDSWKDSPINRGPGFHHLAFEVDDFDGALSNLARQGVFPLPRFPFETPHGRVAFFPPEQTGGILVELCEKQEDER